jgi:hypothetical protein
MNAAGKITVAKAPLPATYVEARKALAKCARVDECVKWADKAMASASYGRQMGDAAFQANAQKILDRAIRRGGELLENEKAAKGGNRGGGRPPKVGNQRGVASPLVSRKALAEVAGPVCIESRESFLGRRDITDEGPAVINSAVDGAEA